MKNEHAWVRVADLRRQAFLVGSVVRVMPNMPAMVGEGAAGFALGARAKESPVR